MCCSIDDVPCRARPRSILVFIELWRPQQHSMAALRLLTIPHVVVTIPHRPEIGQSNAVLVGFCILGLKGSLKDHGP